MQTVFEETGPRTVLALPSRTVLNSAYEIGRVLGKGGFGITYAALDSNLQVPVAIKEFLPAHVAGRAADRSTVEPHGHGEQDAFEHGLDAFIAEAQTLAQFDHPNIVRVQAFFRQNGTGYFVMPFYEGRTLDAVIHEHEGMHSASDALDWVRPVMDGLEIVHARNLLHRDVKPQNVYLTDSGGTILLDFGAARIAFGQESRSLSAVLTPGYAPFEQYSRRGHQGPWTDVYATAAVLYRMVTGSKPPEATDRVAGQPLAPIHLTNPSVPPFFARAITAALEPMPADRPQTIAAFRAMLDEDPNATLRYGDTSNREEKTVLVDDSLRTDPGSRPRTARETPQTGLLVLDAQEDCRARINSGDVLHLARGESLEVAVLPGTHRVEVSFGDQRDAHTLQVYKGERRLVPLAPPVAPNADSDRAESRRGARRTDEARRTQRSAPKQGPVRQRPAASGDAEAPPPSTEPLQREEKGTTPGILLGIASLVLVVGLVVLVSALGTDTVQDDPFGEVAEVLTPHYVLDQPGEPIRIDASLGVGDVLLDGGEYADRITLDPAGTSGLYVAVQSEEFDPLVYLLDSNDDVVAVGSDYVAQRTGADPATTGHVQSGMHWVRLVAQSAAPSGTLGSEFEASFAGTDTHTLFVTSKVPGAGGQYVLGINAD